MSQDAPAEDHRNLTASTLSGIRWTYLATAIGAVLQLGFAAIVSRLLPTEAFGLIAVAQLALQLSGHFARMGVSQALINKRVLRAEDVRAGFTSGALLGAAFALLFWLLAPLAPAVFTSVGAELADDLVAVVRVMGLTMLLSGLSMTAQSLLRRELRFKELAAIDIASYSVAYYGIGLAVALTYGGVEALVAANVGQWVLLTAGSFLRRPHDVRPVLRGSAFRELYGYGSRISLISVLEFLGENLDTASVARYEGASAAGAYNRAYTLVSLPLYYATNSLNEVLFPGFSRIQDDSARVRRTYLEASGVSAALLWPTCAGIAVASPELVAVVLGPRWDQVVPLLPIIAAATAFHFLSNLSGIVLTATARLNQKLLLEGVYVALLAGAMLAVAGRGPEAFALVLATGEVLRHVAFVVILRRVSDIPVGDHMRGYLAPAGAAVLTAAAIAAVRTGLLLLGAAAPLVLIAELAAGAASLILCLRIGPLRSLRDRAYERLRSAGGLAPGARTGIVIQRLLGRSPPSGTGSAG